jgi:hypothetical protein
LGHERLESVPPNHHDPVTRFCATETLPMCRLQKQFNHKDHHEHKERGVNLLLFFVSFVVRTKWRWIAWTKPSLSRLRFRQNGIRIAVSSTTRSSSAYLIQEIARHPLASFASFCSKMRQGVTQRAQQPAGHSRFLLLVAIFGPKKCAPLGRTSHKWRTSICDTLSSQTRPVSRYVLNTCEKNTCDL